MAQGIVERQAGPGWGAEGIPGESPLGFTVQARKPGTRKLPQQPDGFPRVRAPGRDLCCDVMGSQPFPAPTLWLNFHHFSHPFVQSVIFSGHVF